MGSNLGEGQDATQESNATDVDSGPGLDGVEENPGADEVVPEDTADEEPIPNGSSDVSQLHESKSPRFDKTYQAFSISKLPQNHNINDVDYGGKSPST